MTSRACQTRPKSRAAANRRPGRNSESAKNRAKNRVKNHRSESAKIAGNGNPPRRARRLRPVERDGEAI
jgi:hypothetical protein